MSRRTATASKGTWFYAGATGALALAALAFGVGLGRRFAPVAGRSTTALGSMIPSVPLLGPHDQLTSLRELLRGQPAVVFDVSVADCSACSNLRLETRIIRDVAPAARLIVIGSGAPRSAFAAYFKSLGVDSTALIDEKRALLTSLGVATEPLSFVVSPSGRILLVDTRSSSATAQFPVGEILGEFKTMLESPDSTVGSSRE